MPQISVVVPVYNVEKYAHPGEDAADVHDNEGGGDHVPDYRGGKGQPVGQAQGHAEGDAPSQLDDGDHRHQGGEQAFPLCSVGQPLKKIHSALLSNPYFAAPRQADNQFTRYRSNRQSPPTK